MSLPTTGDLFSENIMKISDNWRRKNHISSVFLQTAKFPGKYFSLRQSCFSFVYFFLNNLLVLTLRAFICRQWFTIANNVEEEKKKLTGSFFFCLQFLSNMKRYSYNNIYSCCVLKRRIFAHWISISKLVVA